jgi:hypothetical protein
MKNQLQTVCAATALLAGNLSTLAQGTAFPYQGQLQNNGTATAGVYNFTFTLFNTNTGGTAMAGPLTNSAIGVTNGLFTVVIDFGAGVWNGATLCRKLCRKPRRTALRSRFLALSTPPSRL